MLTAEFECSYGCKVGLIVDTAKNSLLRIKAGERSDVAILLAESIETLVESGVLIKESCQPFAYSKIGLAVASDAQKPDIRTVDAFKRTLLDARSIAYTVYGPSGIYFQKLIERLGIAETIRKKLVTRPGVDYIGALVTSGDAELAVQQISELMAVPGLDLIGPIPQEVQHTFESRVAVFADSKQFAMAAELLTYIKRPEHRYKFCKLGLEQVFS